MSGAKVSVAMCTYNGEAYVGAQLQSIARQSRLPDELVVCDDGSSDSTLDILNGFARTAELDVFIHSNPERLGSTRNFERAIGLCRGDVIALSDQDDVWLPTKVSTLVSALEADSGVGAVISDAEMVDQQLRSLGYGLWSVLRFPRRDQVAMRSGGAFDVLLNHNVVTGATMAFRRSLVDLAAPFPVGWVHDAWLAIVIATRARIEPIPRRLIQYRQHSSQQLGASKRTIGTHVSRALSDRTRGGADSKAAFVRERARLEELRDRLLASGASSYAASVAGKILHLGVRASLPMSMPKRLPLVWRELRAGCYTQYSNAWASAFIDLVR